jgi:hypothetical protein
MRYQQWLTTAFRFVAEVEDLNKVVSKQWIEKGERMAIIRTFADYQLCLNERGWIKVKTTMEHEVETKKFYD